MNRRFAPFAQVDVIGLVLLLALLGAFVAAVASAAQAARDAARVVQHREELRITEPSGDVRVEADPAVIAQFRAALTARSTGQLGYEVSGGQAVAPTQVKVRGTVDPKLTRARGHVALSGLECMSFEPSGAVLVDTLCCQWVPHGPGGVLRLQRRSDFASSGAPPRVIAAWKAQCTQRAGKPLGTTP
jgi:hypothetical protein